MPRNKKLAAPQVMRFKPHRSPVDGSAIDTPEQRHEHNRRHNVVDVGNDRSVVQERPKGATVREDLIENLKKLESK